MGGCQSTKAPDRIELNTNWQFKAVDSASWLPAVVPGVVQTDLQANGLISDPLQGNNEEAVQWIEGEEWEYRTRFTLTDVQQQYQNIDLVFDGLDTYAEVFLNNKSVLKTNNMFRQWRLDSKDLLEKGENEIRIVFTPPILKNKNKVKQLGYKLPAGAETGTWQVSPFTRKAAYQFGWDFAPRLVTMGLWQSVYLELWDIARIANVNFVLKNIGNEQADYTVFLIIYAVEDNTKCMLKVKDKQQNITLKEGLNKVAMDVSIKQPRLWWPNGWGEAFLYDIPIQISSGNLVVDSLHKKLGIRTIELVQEEDDVGRSFYFKINGRKLFAKGANWTPLSSFPSSIPDSMYVNRLQAVKDAHMNLLRVWGGGIYERDLFYNLCDELGILVWQDFMFANSMYPDDKGFIENVTEEVREQVIRLRSHPSLALWNGNNEIEVAWNNWGWQKQFGYSVEDSLKIWLAYERLFKQTIPKIIAIFDAGKPYTSTSPLSNWGKPENFNTGSMHYWGVWHGKDNFDDFKTHVGRFMVEYGFQSYPDYKTVAYYTGSDDLNLSSATTHQKSYVGNGLIVDEIVKHFGNIISFNSFLRNSQKTQALALKMAIEAHRLNKDNCGGTLFWQLNDCWPGPSWSVIDYFGRKKLAYWVVKDRYKPVILAISSQNNAFMINVINDRLQSEAATLTLELFTTDQQRVWVTEKALMLKANKVDTVYRSNINKLLDGMPENKVYLKATLTLKNGSVEDIEKFYFTKPKDYKGDYDMIGLK